MPTLERPPGERWGFWWAANLVRVQAILVLLVAINNLGIHTIWEGFVSIALWAAASQIGGVHHRAIALVTIGAQIPILGLSAYAVISLGWYYWLFVATCGIAGGALLALLLGQGRGAIADID
jgi:hypothetical protein